MNIEKNGHHRSQSHRQLYHCKGYGKCFDDLTDTIFEGSQIDIKLWILCLYFMGLNLSNSQISQELDIIFDNNK